MFLSLEHFCFGNCPPWRDTRWTMPQREKPGLGQGFEFRISNFEFLTEKTGFSVNYYILRTILAPA